jgi:hypothetical protein
MKPASSLASSLEHRLSGYALAASAAGVSLLALSQPAEAKIVYTPAHEKVRINRTLPLDLNHDGIHDFGILNLTHNSTTPFGDFVAASPLNSGNEIWVQATNRGFNNYAVALRAGVRIGPPAKRFQSGRDGMAFVSIAGGTFSGGPWKNVRNRYLGLKFLIKGKVHYGWARLNVTIANREVHAILTGYAYETLPGKPIVAGRTKGNSSLGELARGGH